ncbi:MAG: class I SAM-dependent methyltransferase [Rickettsiales bacterium]
MSRPNHDDKTVDFGFENIPLEEKTARVRSLFSGVAAKYDVMNDAMSLGLHRVWKKRFVAELPLRRNMRVLDVAGGTGDISAEMLCRRSDIRICLADICDDMLRRGREKLREAFPPGEGRILPAFHCVDAQSLPYADNAFDVYTIAFGIRNVADKARALAEAYRVLKPGGTFACLEFSTVEHPLLAKAYNAYAFGCLPIMGKLLANNPDAYRYLAESIAVFPDAETFEATIKSARFKRTRRRPMSGGVVCVHTGMK